MEKLLSRQISAAYRTTIAQNGQAAKAVVAALSIGFLKVDAGGTAGLDWLLSTTNAATTGIK